MPATKKVTLTADSGCTLTAGELFQFLQSIPPDALMRIYGGTLEQAEYGESEREVNLS